MNKTRNTLLMLFLLFGLFVSGIGTTWCHYQVVEDFDFKYLIRKSGTFEMDYDSTKWIFDETTQTYSNEFIITNKNSQKNYLNIHINTTEKADYSIVIIENSGREVKYNSLLIKEENNQYQYKFIDKEGNNLRLALEENASSKQHVRLEATNVTNAFQTEIILLDASYDIKKLSQNTTSQYKELNVSSNYLTPTGNLNILVEDKTLELTFDSNMTINTKLTTTDTNVLVDNKKELEFIVNANETKTVTLDVSKIKKDTFIVTWDILDDQGNPIQTLKANFIIKKDAVAATTIVPVVEMTYVNDISTFNKYEPIKLTLKSDITATIQIGDIFPVNTYYSLDEGKTWYVITKENDIDVDLTFGQPITLTIDLSKTNILWQEIEYDIYSYQGEYFIQPLTFYMQDIQIEELEIVESNMGIIHEEKIEFTLNTEHVKIIMEEYSEGQYIELKEPYFTLETTDNLSYTVKPNDTEIPKGTYRVRIIQSYKDILIKEEALYFFSIE